MICYCPECGIPALGVVHNLSWKFKCDQCLHEFAIVRVTDTKGFIFLNPPAEDMPELGELWEKMKAEMNGDKGVSL